MRFDDYVKNKNIHLYHKKLQVISVVGSTNSEKAVEGFLKRSSCPLHSQILQLWREWKKSQ